MRANMARVLRDRLGEEPAEALVAFVKAAGEFGHDGARPSGSIT